MTAPRSVRAAAVLFFALGPTPLLAADFNGDGFDDLAVGVPFEDVGGGPVVDAGAVTVIYGGPGGLGTGPAGQFWSQSSPGVADVAEVGDQFGRAVATGDFNGDGFDDLAVGAPFENLPGAADSGVVHVIYGSPGGLSTAFFPPQFFTQATTGVEVNEAGDHFGAALASGDFNTDGLDDLAMGIPDEDSPGGLVDAGAAIVEYGAPPGLGFGLGPSLLFQSMLPAPDGSETGDHFGAALASGDFDTNGADDLAVGSPGEDLGGIVDAGAVHAIYGLPFAPLTTFFMPPVFITQGAYTTDPPEPGDSFGRALAAGNFGGFGADGLAVGAPFEDFAGDADTGMVNVVHGVPGGGLVPFAFPPQNLTQDSPGVPEVTDPGDNFGWSLASGQIGVGPLTDLLVGVFLEDVGGVADCGCFHDFYGVGGLGLGGAAGFWHQNSAAVPEVNGMKDLIGASMAIGDFDGNGFADAAAGVPGEDVGGVPIMDAGGETVIYAGGGGAGLGGAPAPQFWSQNSAGIPEASDTGDGMGWAGASD